MRRPTSSRATSSSPASITTASSFSASRSAISPARRSPGWRFRRAQRANPADRRLHARAAVLHRLGPVPRRRDPPGNAADDGAGRPASHRQVPRHRSALEPAGVRRGVRLSRDGGDGASGGQTLRGVVDADRSRTVARSGAVNHKDHSCEPYSCPFCVDHFFRLQAPEIFISCKARHLEDQSAPNSWRIGQPTPSSTTPAKPRRGSLSAAFPTAVLY